jgi:hypothetical protein
MQRLLLLVLCLSLAVSCSGSTLFWPEASRSVKESGLSEKESAVSEKRTGESALFWKRTPTAESKSSRSGAHCKNTSEFLNLEDVLLGFVDEKKEEIEWNDGVPAIERMTLEESDALDREFTKTMNRRRTLSVHSVDEYNSLKADYKKGCKGHAGCKSYDDSDEDADLSSDTEAFADFNDCTSSETTAPNSMSSRSSSGRRFQPDFSEDYYELDEPGNASSDNSKRSLSSRSLSNSFEPIRIDKIPRNRTQTSFCYKAGAKGSN